VELRKLAGAALVLSMAVPAGAAAGEPVNGAIAFSGKRLGKPVIYLRGLEPSRPRVLPTRGWARQPAVSPGGRRIAFTRRGRLGAQIWSSYLDGSAMTQLTSGPQDFRPRWSPEGDAVVFARGAAGRRDLYRVRADGTGLRRLTFARADDRNPSWSVTGRIAFVRRYGKAGHVYDIAATGGRARRLTGGSDDDRWPAWSPTGRTLVFSRGRSSRRDLYLLSSDGSHTRRLTALPGAEDEPAWSPDGRWIAFTYRSDGRTRLYLLRVGQRPVARLGSHRLRALGSSRSDPQSPDWQAAGTDPVVAAAGDIACDPRDRNFRGGLGTGAFCRQRMTSDLLLRMDLDAILALGDLQYTDGQLWKFQQSFDASWGRLKPLIRPAPGNHEYKDPGAAGYFDYFNGPGQPTGPAGTRGQGWYSFDVGSWHLIALNSECTHASGCGAGDLQAQWLRGDLAAHPAACTLAFWHSPRFTSGEYPAGGTMLPVWNELYAANADVILNGHEHFYERFAPQTPAGGADPARGIRQFAVGTGGRSRFRYTTVAPNSEVRRNDRSGVLRLALEDGAYRWQLVAAPDGAVLDSGETSCH
jgi:Tol biopolymer transport system component